MGNAALVQIFQALSDETRLRIIAVLSRQRPYASCQMIRQQFNLSQPAMSHHFRILKESKLIRTRKEGRNVYYSLNRDRLNSYLQKFMESVERNT